VKQRTATRGSGYDRLGALQSPCQNCCICGEFKREPFGSRHPPKTA